MTQNYYVVMFIKDVETLSLEEKEVLPDMGTGYFDMHGYNTMSFLKFQVVMRMSIGTPCCL